MSDEFERSLAKVLLEEGGYSNHPADKGGATMKGVTQGVYDDYRKLKGLHPRGVKLLEDDELKEIYRKRYWDLVKGDQLPAGVSYVVFDGAVNSGPGQSVKWLQRALGINADGLIGPQTLAALKTYPDMPGLIDKICDLRLQFVKSLSNYNAFGKGWVSRISRVRKVGKAWAIGSNAGVSAPIETAPQKARVSDVKKAPPKAPGDVAVGGGTAGVVLTQSLDQLRPLSDNPGIARIIAILTVASVLLALGGLAYRMWAKHKADKIKEAVG